MKIPKNFDPKAFQLDTSKHFAAISGKLPSDITNGMKPLSHYMEIPCKDCIPFQEKGKEDFAPLDEETFQNLMSSILEQGVLDPIIVRRTGEHFEILSGEHRWKASNALGNESIPAQILQDCDDDTAKAIFVVTNLARRQASLRDKVNGWWMVTQATRYKKQEQIQELIDQGLVPKDLQSLSKKQQSRYAILHQLLPQLFPLLENKHLDLHTGGLLAQLPEEKQEDLLPYFSYLKDKKAVLRVISLEKGEISGCTWCEKDLEALLKQPPTAEQAPSVGTMMRQAKQQLKARIPLDCYEDIDEILGEALDLYQEKHPDRGLRPGRAEKHEK